MSDELQELVNQIEPCHRHEFKRYIVTGEASEEFKQHLKTSKQYQEIEDKILVLLYKPLADAIRESST